MPVFLDASKKRIFYFRGTAIFLVSFIVGCTALFLIGLAFFILKGKPVSYDSTIERYHYYYSAANNKKIALTVDDGPYPPAAETFWTALKEYNAPATFFYIGERALVRPDLVKKAAEMGFDIENHTFTHGEGIHNSYKRLAFELQTTGYLLNQVTGSKPLFYRPPFLLGIGIDPTINPYIPLQQDMLWSLELGYTPVGSDIDPKDWLATSTDEVIAGLADAIKNTPNGHIVLLHEDINTAKAIPQIITYLRSEGYSIVPLKELLTPPTEVALLGTLKPGDTDLTSNGDVSRMQWFLYKEKYLDAYGLSGIFDSQTKAALIAFQVQNHLVDPSNPQPGVIGVAGAATIAAIHRLSVEDNKDSLVAAAPENPFRLTASVGGDYLRNIYVYIFPVLRAFLIGMIFLTLILVVARSLGLVFLIMREKKRIEDTAETYAELPGVSVLIPAYNEEENIAATVESILSSFYSKYEVIVIDDGSKDSTADEVRGVIESHPGEAVRLIQLQNGGKAHALNHGLDQAQYPIVVVLDADAVLDREALRHFAKHFNDPAVGAVAGKVRTTGNATALDLFQTLEYAIGQNIDKRAFSTIGAVGVVPGPAGAWRKEHLLEVGKFSTETLVEDQDMTLTLLRRGKKVIYEPDAIAYTETPHSVKNFLKQRFRWVYGTMQCFWKHKGAITERPDSIMSLVVLPNVFVFNILLPLAYPFADSALIFGLLFGQWSTLVIPFIAFTLFDLVYAMWGVWKEPNAWRLIIAVPLQRIVYRQLLYYTVMRGVVRALEGTGSAWNKFTKVGETRRFYFTAMTEQPTPTEPVLSPMAAIPSVAGALVLEPQSAPQLIPEEVTTSFQGPTGTAPESTNLQEVVALSSMPRHFQSAGDTSSPAWAPNVLTGTTAEPNTYAKSSSPFGPTSSH